MAITVLQARLIPSRIGFIGMHAIPHAIHTFAHGIHAGVWRTNMLGESVTALIFGPMLKLFFSAIVCVES